MHIPEAVLASLVVSKQSGDDYGVNGSLYKRIGLVEILEDFAVL